MAKGIFLATLGLTTALFIATAIGGEQAKPAAAPATSAATAGAKANASKPGSSGTTGKAAAPAAANAAGTAASTSAAAKPKPPAGSITIKGLFTEIKDAQGNVIGAKLVDTDGAAYEIAPVETARRLAADYDEAFVEVTGQLTEKNGVKILQASFCNEVVEDATEPPEDESEGK